MNRFALTAAALLTAAAFPAVAADVNVYGRIDTGFLYTINHNQTSDSFEMTSGKSTGSRWGLKGSEQLNEDWQVRFVLESGFDSDAGSFTTTSGDRLFGRQATLSVYNKSFGELALGRSGKPLSGSDQFTRISRFTPFGVTYGDAGLFTVVLAGSLNTSKEDAPEWVDNERFLGGSVDYKLGNWGVMVGAEQTVLKRAEEADNQEENPTTLFLGTSYDFGFMKLMAAYQRGWHLDRVGSLSSIKITPLSGGTNAAQIENWTGNSFMLGAQIPCAGGLVRLSGILVDGENGRDIASNKVGELGRDAGYWAVAAGYTYPLSKRTNVYGVVSHLEGRDGLDNDKYSIYNGDGDLDREQVMVGLVHKF